MLSDPREAGDATLPLPAAQYVDRVCLQFEAAWRAGARPRTEDLLDAADEPTRSELVRELLALEIEYRRRLGEEPTADEYLGRLPGHAPAVREAFRTACRPVDTGQVLGDYELLELRGRGGMGAVYRARQRGTNRVVALKVIRPDQVTDLPPEKQREWRERFRREVELAARLEHEHIVTVYAVGESDGRHFFSMRYIDGPSLEETLRAGPLPGRHAAALLEPVARAVQYAHERGILHRDLTPRNILVDAAGRPFVADFGLAKEALGATEMTRTGQVLGTPSYMAPEQVQDAARVTPAADVYALGATLYHLVTGRPPFQAPTLTQTFHQVLAQDPVPPRQLNPGIDRDLETIALHCLQKEPARRYPSAQALADDLRRYLDGRVIRARPVGPLGRLGRWCRRNPVTAGLVALVFLALLTTAGASTWAALASRARAEALQREADQRRLQEQDHQREVLLQRMQVVRLTTHSNGWSERAWDLVQAAAQLHSDERVRDQAVAGLAGLDARLVKILDDSGASAVAFDRDGQRLLVGGTGRHHTGPARAGRLWDARTDQLQSTRTGPGPVAFRPDVTPLQLLVENGHDLILWDVERRRAVGHYHFGTNPNGPLCLVLNDLDLPVLALVPDGSRLAAAAKVEGRGVVAVWDATTGRLLGQRSIDEASALAFSPDGTRLAVGDRRGQTRVWPVPLPERPEQSFPATGSAVHSLAFSPDARRLAVGSGGGSIAIWDRQTAGTIRCFGSQYDVYAVAFSPDGVFLASGGRMRTKLWDSWTGRLLLDIDFGEFASGLAFSPDGSRLAISLAPGYTRGAVAVWELHNGRGIQTLYGLGTQISFVCFSPDGRQLAALAHDWTVGVWELPGGRLRGRFPGPRGVLADNAGLCFSPDGRRLACAAGTEARLWDLATRREQRWTLPRGLTDALAFSADGRRLLHFRRESRDEGRSWVCPMRDLLGREPTRPLFELRDFDRGLHATRAAADGSWFVAEGVRERSSGKQQLVVAFDSVTGARRWVLPKPKVQAWGYLSIQPSGRTLTVRMMFPETHDLLLDAASGAVLAEWPSAACCADDTLRFAVIHSSLHPATAMPHLALLRLRDRSVLTLLNLDARPSFQPEFDRSGGRVAWGNVDGTVTVCDLERIRARLGDVGLGW